MTRLPKKRGITQVGEDKSLILRQHAALMGLMQTVRKVTAVRNLGS